MFSFSPSNLIMESSTLVPFSRSAFALSFVMKQSEAPLSHRTLTQSRFVGIRCNCSRQESAMLLSHTLADPEISCREVSIFSSLVHPFTPQGLFFLHSSSLCSLRKHDQQAPFSFNIFILSSFGFNR